jgi:DNA-binding response OmpR family regulator
MTTTLGIGPREIAAQVDPVVGPRSSTELAARTHISRGAHHPINEEVVCFGDVEVNIALRRIWRRGEEVRMPPGEFNLLLFFLRNVDMPLTRETLLSQVWGYQVQPKTRTVDVHVVRLRQKLEPDPDVPQHFQTIHGFGYRFMMRPARPLTAIR